MNQLSFSEMATLSCGSEQFWWGFGCITSAVGYVGSIVGLTMVTGGLWLGIAVGGHIMGDLVLETSCAAWIKSMQE